MIPGRDLTGMAALIALPVLLATLLLLPFPKVVVVGLSLGAGLVCAGLFPWTAEKAGKLWAGFLARWRKQTQAGGYAPVRTFMAGPASAPDAPKPQPLRKALAFAGQALGFVLKHWQIIAIALVLIAAYGALRPVWGFFTTSKAELRQEIDDLRGRLSSVEAQFKLNAQALLEADRTTTITRIITQRVEDGQVQIEAAANSGDFEALYRAYADASRSVWRAPSPSPPSDRDTSRPDGAMPGSRTRDTI